ncbi:MULTISPECIES: extensin family protein [unclassified Pseudomonas]|uniref:extensin-like domain-containing protein n=1 Tax=unclassified Pseudomonas TaxID=196821 RepID=UPI0008718E7D|nr:MULTISPECIES: extensin family protein [unclassified Pseudomonas]SCW97867.1 Extensin-like protein C-terminus [Pseudomonas sp. NFACC05-1]SCZ24518.1 Extensin-like protein C-terminus [Pseudomonas sp. NFACC44-2]SDA66418.1 Extensin-like protein C-terminus [Pseudomonas sp. NFACC51]SEI93076.1 Extensin-like protein C-terminus [Pseudomonas sp. NFACC07-1]SFI41447.1 Extensin-like protein C-terminus [Pseudomonas sp. NFACC54]
MRFLKVLAVVALLVGVAVLGVWRGWVSLPPQWNPWAPLDVNLAPNLLTRFKLMALRNDPQLCDQALATSGLRTARQADSGAHTDCPLTNVLRVQGGEVALSSSFLASCPLAVAFALFERHALQPAAVATYGQRVARVDHLGSFACRNMYGRESGARSQHATASALDIAGFRLADGRTISVLRDWPKDSADARFLRQVREGACDMFSVVLSPDYNAAHRNHFHLDVGPWWICR